MMRTTYRCEGCDAATPQWAGRCPRCGAWGALAEEQMPAAASSAGRRRAPSGGEPLPIAGLGHAGATPFATGVGALDRVLGGGLVPGSVTLVGGEPGVGKSTLLLQAAAGVAAGGGSALVVTGEESAGQVGARATRLGLEAEAVWVLAETDLPAILDATERRRPSMLLVDSVQTVAHPDASGAPGSVSQVRECAQALVSLAKTLDVAVVLAGHVTKDGDLAGPRALEHVVDTVLSFEGDRHHALRLLRAVKHRFGAAGELEVMEMRSTGLVDVPDASGLFLADRRPGTLGSVVTPLLDGVRPVLVEVQALIGGEPSAARRATQGFDAGRLAMILAVLARYTGIDPGRGDVYLSVAGGLRATEPGADLAVALALASIVTSRPVGGDGHQSDVVVVGEVGLGGEIRQVQHVERRLVEASRTGFSRAIVPASTPAPAEGQIGVEMVRIATVGEALAAAGLA